MSPTETPDKRLTLTRPIVLVGLMGAGKTSVGRRLAAALGVAFRDSDHEIETAAGLEIREIFERFGEAYFRDGEQKVVRRLLSDPPGVLATGGGAFVSPHVREAVSDLGVSVWLNADLATLWERVRDKPTRPLLQKPNAREVLGGLLADRAPVYALADIEVHSDRDVTQDRMVRRIIAAIQAHDAAHPERPPTLQQEA